MIHCAKCRGINPPEATVCATCGDPLLPQGHPLRAALFHALGALGLFRTARQTQAADPYWQRAQRHETLDPQQAIADVQRALELAPIFSARRSSHLRRLEMIEFLGSVYKRQERNEDVLAVWTDTIADYNQAAKATSNIAKRIYLLKSRDAFCQRHSLTAPPSGAMPVKKCLKCGTTAEGDIYSFYYGYLLEKKSSPWIEFDIGLGHYRQTIYQIKGEIEGFLCFNCMPDSGSVPKGRAIVMDMLIPTLKNKRYTAFLTPPQYAKVKPYRPKQKIVRD